MLTHPQLLKQVWGPAYTDAAHYLRVYMAQLRRKLESDPTRPRYLLTEPGVGYRLAAEQIIVPHERSFQIPQGWGFGSDFAASKPPLLSSQKSTTAILINMPYTDRRPAMYASTAH